MAAGTLLLAAPTPLPAALQEAASGGLLGRLWTIDGALEDGNGDGFADATRLDIQVLDEDDEAQLAAAANVSARLGFETMSLDLPLRPGNGDLTVIIGSASSLALRSQANEAEPRGYVFVG